MELLTAAGAACPAGGDCAADVDEVVDVDLEEEMEMNELIELVKGDVVEEDAVDGAIVNPCEVLNVDSIDTLEVDEPKTSVGFRTIAELSPGRNTEF